MPGSNLCPMLLLMKNEWVDYSHGERAYISYNPYVSPQQAARILCIEMGFPWTSLGPPNPKE